MLRSRSSSLKFLFRNISLRLKKALHFVLNVIYKIKAFVTFKFYLFIYLSISLTKLKILQLKVNFQKACGRIQFTEHCHTQKNVLNKTYTCYRANSPVGSKERASMTRKVVNNMRNNGLCNPQCT
jgi:hypothetical protein